MSAFPAFSLPATGTGESRDSFVEVMLKEHMIYLYIHIYIHMYIHVYMCSQVYSQVVDVIRENTIKAGRGKNTNLNGTKETYSHIRCIRMNGPWLLKFTIYCFASFFCTLHRQFKPWTHLRSTLRPCPTREPTWGRNEAIRVNLLLPKKR